jgi:hypothetical protein
MASHGTRYMYQKKGCRCDACTQANRDYFKARNQAKNAEKHGGGTVTVLKTVATGATQPAVREIGPNEAGTLLELEGLPAAASRPGLVQVVLTLARLMDSPMAIAQHPQAAGRWAEIMDRLRKGAEKKGRLSAVRQMTSPGIATG